MVDLINCLNNMFKIGILIMASVSVASICCISLIPERANVTEFNEKFLEYARVYITRKSRKSPYYINIEGRIKQTCGNNITMAYLFYEYLHNEYRRTFVEMHGELCDLLYKKVDVIGKMLQNAANLTCPLKPADYHLLNMTLPMMDFKYFFPFQKFRVEVIATQTATKELVFKAYMNAFFKDTHKIN